MALENRASRAPRGLHADSRRARQSAPPRPRYDRQRPQAAWHFRVLSGSETMPAISTGRVGQVSDEEDGIARQARPGPRFNGEEIGCGEDLTRCARRNCCQVVPVAHTEPTREIVVDWRLTTQPNSDELADTQLKSRSPEVLTPQHSDTLGATQHNSAKLGQFGLLICGLWVRFPPGSPDYARFARKYRHEHDARIGCDARDQSDGPFGVFRETI
jgi:hypothetical protein